MSISTIPCAAMPCPLGLTLAPDDGQLAQLDLGSLLLHALSTNETDPVQGILDGLADEAALLRSALRHAGTEIGDSTSVEEILWAIERRAAVAGELARRIAAGARAQELDDTTADHYPLEES